MNIKVSIIIPFFNCPFIAQSIESALNQTYQNIEVIVVNDGSTMHNDKIIPYLSRITYLEKGNGGTASALNTGIKNASGDYFAWLSSDDLFQPTKIEKQLHFMLQNNAMASYSNFYLINNQGSIVSHPQGIGFSNQVQFLKRMRRGCVINGCTVMLNMNVFKQFGLFDESLLYTQDYDFWLRILPHFHFYYFPDALVHYRVHENMGTKRHKTEIRKELQTTIQRHLTKINALVKSVL
ncbi:glycosyltransferase [Fictibacillus norfolkensis]|uniref:Glycosyltransferase n=1 Tax=Fictibacillus norfolkensis TaxID=2762233 RepID=A0ABR8SQ07_9BACL|nr:glycosyltransferase [Fictibacillus norfolkensis]MBD7965587.1 glycosyltransferase [Fictibacillus norfolkensis]